MRDAKRWALSRMLRPLGQDFAEWNRQAIADELVKGMKLDVVDSFSTVHNYIDPDTMILRKGAGMASMGL